MNPTHRPNVQIIAKLINRPRNSPECINSRDELRQFAAGLASAAATYKLRLAVQRRTPQNSSCELLYLH
jgi:hypothetical protein